jgi:hypothetical protein
VLAKKPRRWAVDACFRSRFDVPASAGFLLFKRTTSRCSRGSSCIAITWTASAPNTWSSRESGFGFREQLSGSSRGLPIHSDPGDGPFFESSGRNRKVEKRNKGRAAFPVGADRNAFLQLGGDVWSPDMIAVALRLRHAPRSV